MPQNLSAQIVCPSSKRLHWASVDRDYKASKEGTQIFILINQKSAFCMLFHENWSVLGFVQVRAVTQACNLHVVGQFLKPRDGMLFPLGGGSRMPNLKLKS